MDHRYLQPVPTLWVRSVGLVMSAAALGFASLSIWVAVVAWRSGLDNPKTSTRVGLLCLFLLLGMFCAFVGARFMFNRPLRNGSLFPPRWWLVLGTVLGGLTTLVATWVITSHSGSFRDAEMLWGMGSLSAWCFVLAYLGRKRALDSAPSNQPLHPTPTAAEAPASGAGERRR